jgi:hypothetical protein
VNRHDRRYAAKLSNFRSAGTLEILAPDRLAALAAADRMFADSLFEWVASIAANRPMCATCQFVFRRDHLPVLWHLIRLPHGQPLLAGSCADCAARFPSDAALMRAVIANYGRATGAQLHMADPANFFHARGGRA